MRCGGGSPDAGLAVLQLADVRLLLFEPLVHDRQRLLMLDGLLVSGELLILERLHARGEVVHFLLEVGNLFGAASATACNEDQSRDTHYRPESHTHPPVADYCR